MENVYAAQHNSSHEEDKNKHGPRITFKGGTECDIVFDSAKILAARKRPLDDESRVY